MGIGTGLAWTDVGGELLTIQAAIMPGKGRMTVTGNLRDVMKESISAAASYVRMRAVAFGIKPPLFDNHDIHVHVPEGAIPKDGPSAGVAMATAIVSVMTGIRVRRDVAMTGEITLRGRVWPIAGLKEKLLAALRGGIKTVLIPEENAKDLMEISDSIKKGLEIVAVSRMDEVLARAMMRKPEPIEWDETTPPQRPCPRRPRSRRKPRRSPRIERSRHRCRGGCHFSKLHHSSKHSSRSLGGNHHGSCRARGLRRERQYRQWSAYGPLAAPKCVKRDRLVVLASLLKGRPASPLHAVTNFRP